MSVFELDVKVEDLSWVLDSAARQIIVADECRHKSKRTTEKYEHSSPTRQQDAVNNID